MNKLELGASFNRQVVFDLRIFRLRIQIRMTVDAKKDGGPIATKSGRVDPVIDSIERFWGYWIGDKTPGGRLISHLTGIPVGPVKSTDLYDLYRKWCHHEGILSPPAASSFLAHLYKRSDCEKRIERYHHGALQKQATFVIPEVATIPTGVNRRNWITESAEAFAESSRSWKGGRNADI